MTKLLTQNSKLKKTSKNGYNVYNFGISAVKTCPSALHCVADCYAQQGAYRWSNVAQAFEKRWEITQQSDFVELMTSEIRKKRNITHVRIHDSGDFYSEEYLVKWLKVMRDNEDITFYAYTKEIKLFKKYKPFLPENFIVIYSYGGKHDNLIDRENDRHAMVYENKEDMPDNYINASENDLKAITENKNVGLIYHGQKKMKGFKRVSA